MKKSALLLSICVCLSVSSFAQINKTEKKIIQSVDKNTASSIELLKRIVNINSGSMNFEGVKKVGMVMKEELTALGFETKWVEGADWGRAGHIVASHKGKKGPGILMIGHLDTVFEPDHPFQQFNMLNDSIIKGPGVADMKGGDVIILLALKALKESGQLDDMNIEVVMTGDEEKSGSPLELSKGAIVEASKRCEIALGFENADGLPETVVTSRRSSSGWTLEVSGNPAHSSQIFTDKVGVGAIYEASRILNEFYLQLSKEENLTFNPGYFIGGTTATPQMNTSGGTATGKSNVVASSVVVKGDLRAISKAQISHAQTVMTKIVNNNYPGTSAKIAFDDGGYPPFEQTNGNILLMEQYSKVSTDLGYMKITSVNPRNAGAADVSFTSDHISTAIDGLGLSGADDHTANETGNLNMVSVQAKRAAVLMYRLSNKKDPVGFRK